jgi:hypothetical protein
MPIRILKKDDESKKNKSKTVSKEEAINMRKDARRDYVRANKMLSGGQAKLDKNKNNKIDAEDFKLLRKEKGKPMKAALGAIALGLGAKKMMDKNKMKMPMGMGAAAAIAAKKKEILGKRMGGVMKARMGKRIRVKDDDSFDTKMKLQEKGVIDKKTGAGRERITKALKATSLGRKLLLPVAAGVAASQYLRSKLKKKEDKNKKTLRDFREQKKPGVPSKKRQLINKALSKKMGGGMMQRPMMAKKGKIAEFAKKKGLPVPLDLGGKGKFKDMGKFPFIKGIGKKDISKKMGGGMMKPMGYKAGKSVKAKCKLGRNKPTKMY